MLRHVTAGRSLLFSILFLALALPGRAGTEQAGPQVPDSGGGFIADWLQNVSRIQSEQPGWVTPVVTVTPRLEQEVRYDQFWESMSHGHTLNSWDGGKGLEFIPTDNVEVIVGVPAYQSRDDPKSEGGFGDENFLFKYRILSANKEHGDYILTAFLGVSLPTGGLHNGAGHEVTTPTIAFGKGWGNFDFQSTVGIAVPDNGAPDNGAGTPVAWNTALQYRILPQVWPEVEFNYTYWPNGDRRYINQLYITPGIVLGRFEIDKRFGCTVGAGCQMAVTDNAQYHRNVILTVRFPF